MYAMYSVSVWWRLCSAFDCIIVRLTSHVKFNLITDILFHLTLWHLADGQGLNSSFEDVTILNQLLTSQPHLLRCHRPYLFHTAQAFNRCHLWHVLGHRPALSERPSGYRVDDAELRPSHHDITVAGVPAQKAVARRDRGEASITCYCRL